VCVGDGNGWLSCDSFLMGNWSLLVSGYGLDDRAIEVRSPAEAKGFSSSLCAGPALGPAHPPVQWVPGVLSPGLKRGRGVTLTTHPIEFRSRK
jgi:hypothetical protein